MAIINAQIIIDREGANFVQVLSLYVIYPYVDKIDNITKLYKCNYITAI